MSFLPLDLADADNQSIAASLQISETEDSRPSPQWTPLFSHACTFGPEIFDMVMLNLIKNPNINSSWLSRADLLLDQTASEVSGPCPDDQPQIPIFKMFEPKRRIVRRLIPRNPLRDDPLEQTCLFYKGLAPETMQRSMVIYLPHVRSESDMPFYHPTVRGIAFLHEWGLGRGSGIVSTHYSFFSRISGSEKLTRTALQLLRVLHKHGEGQMVGYKKRVHHDVLVPQAALQDRYATLKQKYARSLVEEWQETTDSGKHVFEDLCIAAFLIELWKDMYQDCDFPGFVDMGCGNGLLVHILNCEKYPGWGFDARARKSWVRYSTQVSVRTSCGGLSECTSLQTRLLLPSFISNAEHRSEDEFDQEQIHDGKFPRGTFIISNHADELTPWTPILARLSECPFLMIPCCSHNLTGARFRAPPPKDKAASPSTYNSLCAWVANIVLDCGWRLEREILRIPSTRNTAYIGRQLAHDAEVDVQALLLKYGGSQGYCDRVAKLLKASTRGH